MSTNLARRFTLQLWAIVIAAPCYGQEMRDVNFLQSATQFRQVLIEQTPSEKQNLAYSFLLGMEQALVTANGKLRSLKQQSIYCQPPHRATSFKEMVAIYLSGYKIMLKFFGDDFLQKAPPAMVFIEGLGGMFPCS